MAAGQSRISIAPNAVLPVYFNPLGQNWHVLVVTVQHDSGSGFVGVVGQPYGVTISDGNGATSYWYDGSGGTLAGVTGAGGVGLTGFSTPTAGEVTASATATVPGTIGNTPVTTGQPNPPGWPPNGPDAVIRWVDARLTLTPANAVNAAGANHTLTSLLEWDQGDGAGWNAVSGKSITIRLTNQDGAVAAPAGPFTSNSDILGHTTATFTSASPGIVLARATATLTVLGTSVPVTTGNAPALGRLGAAGRQNGPDASKVFI